MKDDESMNKNELISLLETENKQLFDKTERLESKLNSLIDTKGKNPISSQISSGKSAATSEEDTVCLQTTLPTNNSLSSASTVVSPPNKMNRQIER